MPKQPRKRPRGRPRAGATAQCLALDPATRRHPARCPACARARQRRVRAERRRQHKLGIALPPARERTEVAEQEHAARANVAVYLRLGKIWPPTMCEACGGGRTPVCAWHPDPANWRQIAWLCRPCRRIARATGGTIVLTWQWPGHTLGEIRTVPVVERPERRARRDRSAPSSAALPAAESGSPPPSPWFDDEAALARLDAELAARFAEVEAINARVAGALAAVRDRQRDDEA
jgi:hypothetical protein